MRLSPLAAFAALSFLATVLAAFALTGDLRPALATGALQAILLRIAVALRPLAPSLRLQPPAALA